MGKMKKTAILPDQVVMDSLQRHAQGLVDWLAPHRRLLVAFSGGVDSSVVAAAAARAGLDALLAVTADSPSVPRRQLVLAQQIADRLGIEHRILPTVETTLPEYRRNDRRRCFHCKQTLYETIGQWARDTLALADDAPFSIASGTNADDLGDYRPGIEAGRIQGVLTPLADLGINKATVRQLASYFGLPNHDLPAAPCLASRIAYGTEVTPQRLRRIEEAEELLRELGFQQVRVRLHADELARIEVAGDELMRMCQLDREGAVSGALRSLGFRYVTLDLEGFQTGSMNRALVSIELPKDEPRKEAVS